MLIMSSADEWEELEDNRNFDRMVEEQVDQILLHRTLPKLFKKVSFYFILCNLLIY